MYESGGVEDTSSPSSPPSPAVFDMISFYAVLMIASTIGYSDVRPKGGYSERFWSIVRVCHIYS
jgi:hypothetical protein